MLQFFWVSFGMFPQPSLIIQNIFECDARIDIDYGFFGFFCFAKPIRYSS